MNTLNSSSETSQKLSTLMNTLAKACNELVDALVSSLDSLGEYGKKTIQGIAKGVKSLFVDTIVLRLRQIDVAIKELRKEHQSPQVQEFIRSQQQQLIEQLHTHTFFRNHFAWRVQEIVS